jgi:hypothetical protein
MCKATRARKGTTDGTREGHTASSAGTATGTGAQGQGQGGKLWERRKGARCAHLRGDEAKEAGEVDD